MNETKEIGYKVNIDLTVEILASSDSKAVVKALGYLGVIGFADHIAVSSIFINKIKNKSGIKNDNSPQE